MYLRKRRTSRGVCGPIFEDMLLSKQSRGLGELYFCRHIQDISISDPDRKAYQENCPGNPVIILVIGRAMPWPYGCARQKGKRTEEMERNLSDTWSNYNRRQLLCGGGGRMQGGAGG